jgi:hypothetical protein
VAIGSLFKQNQSFKTIENASFIWKKLCLTFFSLTVDYGPKKGLNAKVVEIAKGGCRRMILVERNVATND